MERHRNQLPSNLPQLQNLMKRDPAAYQEEFMQQYNHYQSLRELLLHSPAQDSPHLCEIVMFIGQVMPCYPDVAASFPMELKQLLQTQSSLLYPDVRMTLCRALILLRNKGMIEPEFVLELFFELFTCQDKALRMLLYSHIVSDIKRINAKHKNNRVNTALQNFMYTMLGGTSKIAARMSLDVMVELYRKNVWRDAKTVNVLATACLSPVTKIMGAALRFFLSGDEEGAGETDSESSDESDVESRAIRNVVLSRKFVKSGRKRERKVAKARAILKKQHKKRKVPLEARFMALHLIHDPQDFAEKLLHRLQKATERFELKLLMMALVSRLVGVHQLFLFNFYPLLQRYLQPHQKEVTKILTYLAQASHGLVPSEILEPVVKAVLNNFITERNSSDVIAMGLNAVREVCVRCPLVMSRELLSDLAGYKTYRDKGVVMAARSLIQLYRNVRPEILQRKDRGHPSYAGAQKVLQYGELAAEEHVPGMELVDIASDPNEDSDVEFAASSESESEWNDKGSEDENLKGDGSSGERHRTKRQAKKLRKRKRVEEKRTESVKGAVDEINDHIKRQRVERAVAISQNRVLTNDEFQHLRIKKACALVEPRKGCIKDAALLTATEEQRFDMNQGELLPEEAITTIHSKLKRSREERIAMSKAGHKGKVYGHKKAKLNPHSSTTNHQKVKNKSFTMMKQKWSIRAKGKRSFRERQITLRNSLQKQRKK